MRHSDSIGELAAALAKAQTAMKGAIADSTNPHFRSRYADLESVRSACVPALAAQGICVLQEVTETICTTKLIHSSGQWLETDVPVFISKKDSQSLGSAMTYSRRYALAAAVCLSQTDDDGQEACTPAKETDAQKAARQFKETVAFEAKAPSQTRDHINACMETPKEKKTKPPVPESNEPYEYPKHSPMVVAAAKELSIQLGRITENRDRLNEFLYTNAYGNLTSIKQAMNTFFKELSNG